VPIRTGQLRILSRTRESAVGVTGPRHVSASGSRLARLAGSFLADSAPPVTFSQSRAAVHGSWPAEPRPRGARPADYAARVVPPLRYHAKRGRASACATHHRGRSVGGNGGKEPGKR
jgi:hypothetical protein